MKWLDPDSILEITREWTGERFADQRPKVSDGLLNRLSNVTTEEAYIALLKKGYKRQYEGALRRLPHGKRLIGRAVTAIMVPSRPDVHQQMLDYGRRVEHRHGSFNQWVVDSLVPQDVLVVDMGDQITFGTFVGGNLSTAIQKRTVNGGAVIWGGIRDLEQIEQIPDYQVFYRGTHPSPIGDVMLTQINGPTRIGGAVCLPGDVVLGTTSGVVFIPPHLADYVASRAEKTHVRDVFGFERLKAGVYTSAQIDQECWSPEMMKDFIQWFYASEKTLHYRHLDWADEIARSSVPSSQKPFDGLIDLSFH